jgi:hypothetical protein
MMNYKSKSDVELVISLAKPEAVVRLFWASYQEGLQYQAWLEQMQSDYDALYPKTETVLVTETDEEGNEAPAMTTDEDGNEFQATKQVPIDYSDNESYVTFDEWMAEREVVTLTRTIIDEDGNEVEESYEADGDLIRSFEANPDAFAVFEESELYREFKKCVGLDYEGVVVPISKDTQDTTTALTLAFENGLAETNFHFENGNKLHLTAETFPAFRDWVMNERVSMFI